MKIIRNQNTIVVVFDDCSLIQSNNCTDEIFADVCKATSKEEVIKTLNPEIKALAKEAEEVSELLEQVKSSIYLSRKDNSIYWDGISELSMPKDLAEKVIDAEINNDKEALEGYRNFWTLLSLNPDPVVRENLYWFLSKWGMTISKSGLFIGYRNVDIYSQGNTAYFTQELCDYVTVQYIKVKNFKKSPKNYFIDLNSKEYKLLKADKIEDLEVMSLDTLYNEFKAVNFIVKNTGDNTVYTDHHSHSFRIKIGEMVTMNRSACDNDSNVSCSRGLHLGGMNWIQQCYFGDQGLVCLCNPTDVVAVPKIDDYGKLRCCAYLPIGLTEYDETGHVIPYNVSNGFESRFIRTILYDGIKATENNPKYVINVPIIPGLNKETVSEQVLNIARTYMK